MRKFVFMIMVFVLSVGTVDMAFGRADKSKVDIHYEEICVSKGETYWDIAKKYHTTVDSIKNGNHVLADRASERVKRGDKLLLVKAAR